MTLNYSSKVWRIGFINSVSVGMGVWQGTAEAIYSENAIAGWTTSLDPPRIEWPKQNDVYWYTGKSYARGTAYPYTFRVARVFVHMPDGTSHELRKSDQVYQDTGSIDMNGTFYALDGSRMRYDSSGATTGTLYLSDGTRYVFSGNTTLCIDRNGNTLSYDAVSRQWTDTMGRVIGMPWPSNPQAGSDYTYVMPGKNGGTITYILKFRLLSNVLSPGSPALTPLSDFYLPYPNQLPTSWNGNNFPQMTQAPSMFVSGYSDPSELDIQSYTRVVGRGQIGSNVFDPVVLAAIVLPNNQSYSFTYNNFGELDKIVYPGGSYERYQYGTLPSLGKVLHPYPQGSRGLTSRWFSASGNSSDEAQWLYTTTTPAAGYLVCVTAPDHTGAPNGVRTETYSYNFWGSETNFGNESLLNGLNFDERVYAPAAAGGAMLSRTLTDWTKTDGVYNRPSPGTGQYTTTRNPRPTKTVKLLLDTGGNALTSTTTVGYDTTYEFTVGLDSTSTSEFGFTTVDQYTAQNGAIGVIPAGPLLRSTLTSHLTNNNNYRSRNILGLVSSTSITDASGTVITQSAIDYDEAAYPLLTYGQVPNWTDPQTTYRGNPTTTSRWLNYPTAMWISTHIQYDQLGNVRSSWDALGRQSQMEYSANYQFAYPTVTTSSAPDPTGMFGQPFGFVSSSSFDFNTGLVLSSTDANGQTTSYEYNDPLNRQTKITRPDGGWTSYLYDDTVGTSYVRTQTLQFVSPAQQVAESYDYVDRLGRKIRSFVREGATFITLDTQYDLLGRVLRVSLPYRSTSLSAAVNPSNRWTTNTYDFQGRTTTITGPDGSHADTAYGYSLVVGYLGSTVTGTDQAGKRRRSLMDAFGRVSQLVEDPNGVAYQTNYSYDVLDNLRKVEQGTQVRCYGYDSLSRVIRVRHVEQTINPQLSWTDPVTGCSNGWTAAFTYDNNGNTLTRVDARNITTTYTYDQLNRLIKVRYTNDPQNTPGVDNYYDGYRNGTYTNVANVKGRLWQNETIGQVRTTVDNFNAIGLPTIQRQQFWTSSAWSVAYTSSATYSLSGDLKSETYPSGHSVNYDKDPAGRLKSFSGNLGDGVSRIYANNFEYNEFGSLQQEQFGTAIPLFHKQRFNVRGQIWDIRLSTVPFSSDPGNGDRGSIVNYYSTNYSPGASGTDNNGNLLRQETCSAGATCFQQNFSYDAVNRLRSVTEKLNGAGPDTFSQVYNYDRWGNRTIDQAQTSANVPRPNFTIDADTNRLVAPAGSSYVYDPSGNLTTDTYTGGGQRAYDAESHMIASQEISSWQYYKYSGSGLRVRRLVNGGEDWMVYGISGSLIAEYRAGAASFAPVKEYGYRGGQLLTTISNGDHRRLYRFVQNLYYGALQRDPTTQEQTDRMNELVVAGAQGQSQLLAKAAEIARGLFAATTYETSPVRSDTQYVTDLYYAYLHRAPDDSGLSWWSGLAAGGVQNRINVLNAFEASGEFQTLVSTLYGNGSSDNQRTDNFVNNLYLGALGRQATIGEIQQQRNRLNNAAAVGQAAVQAEAESIGRELLGSQVSNQGITDGQFVTNLYEAFLQRGPDSMGLSFWTTEASGGPNKRQNVLNAFATCGPFRDLAGTLYREVFWVVGDHLASIRMVVDRSGSVNGVKRHDFLPFGEEIGGPQVGLIGGRELAGGYLSDSVKQKYTGYEADPETGLNFAQARYQSSVQGRFTSVDPLDASADPTNPQSFNRYNYVINNPTKLIDPSGMVFYGAEYSYSDVAEGFWGNRIAFNEPHFKGTSIIFAAEYLWNLTVAARVHELYETSQRSKYSKPNWLEAALNAAIDKALGFTFVGGGGSVSVSAEVTSTCQDTLGAPCTPQGMGPFVISGLQPNDALQTSWASNQPPVGEGWCAEFVQVMAEKQGTPMGLAGSGRWRKGGPVMGGKLKRGTVIASGWSTEGYYPNFTYTGNHAAIFLSYLEDGSGFLVLEQLHGKIKVNIKNTRGPGANYFNNPYAYNVVMVGPAQSGVPASINNAPRRRR